MVKRVPTSNFNVSESTYFIVFSTSVANNPDSKAEIVIQTQLLELGAFEFLEFIRSLASRTSPL